MNAKDSLLLWSPKTGESKVVPRGHGKKYPHLGSSSLGCYARVRDADFETRKTFVFIEAMHLIIRDGVDPKQLHNELMKLEEYRDGCSCDMPMMENCIDGLEFNDWVLSPEAA